MSGIWEKEAIYIMKIEKISENQIKCTLTRQDLKDRELQLSELAYGSSKAKALFSELMLQASYECGFDAEGAPLMIEAIPFDPDSLVLIVSKVSNPEDLDEHFSKLSIAPEELLSSDKHPKLSAEARNVLLSRLSDVLAKATDILSDGNEPNSETDDEKKAPELQKVYTFDTLFEVSNFAKVINPFYSGKNSLYKDDWDDRYYLVLNGSLRHTDDFTKVCNIASEYGTLEPTRYASVSYFDEHFVKIIKDSAVKKLAAL